MSSFKVKHKNRTHLIITVAGIRTYGHWQDKLETFIHASSAKDEHNICCKHLKVKRISSLKFLSSEYRKKEVAIFKSKLTALINSEEWERIDLVGHSFGTYVIGKALLELDVQDCKNIHTVILSGSILDSSSFDIEGVLNTKAKVVLNESGIYDLALYGLTVVRNIFRLELFKGGCSLAGLYGFLPHFTGDNHRNNFYNFGHSGFFKNVNGSSDDFMHRYWVPLLATGESLHKIDQRSSPKHKLFFSVVYNQRLLLTFLLLATLFTVLFLGWKYYDNNVQEIENQRIISLINSASSYKSSYSHQASRDYSEVSSIVKDPDRKKDYALASKLSSGEYELITKLAIPDEHEVLKVDVQSKTLIMYQGNRGETKTKHKLENNWAAIYLNYVPILAKLVKNGSLLVAATNTRFEVIDIFTGNIIYSEKIGVSKEVLFQIDDNERLVLVGHSKGITVYDLNLKKKAILQSPISEWVYSTYISSDGTKLIAMSNDRIDIWNSTTLQKMHSHVLPLKIFNKSVIKKEGNRTTIIVPRVGRSPNETIRGVDLNLDVSSILIWTNENKVYSYTLNNEKGALELLFESNSDINWAVFSENEQNILIRTEKQYDLDNITIIRVSDKSIALKEFLLPLQDQFKYSVFMSSRLRTQPEALNTRRSRVLIVQNNRLKLLDTASLEIESSFNNISADWADSAMFYENYEGIIVLERFNQLINLWSPSYVDQQSISSKLKSRLLDYDVSPDGKYLLLVSEKNETEVWDIQTKNILNSVAGDTEKVISARFANLPNFDYSTYVSTTNANVRIYKRKYKELVMPDGLENNNFDNILSCDKNSIVLFDRSSKEFHFFWVKDNTIKYISSGRSEALEELSCTHDGERKYLLVISDRGFSKKNPESFHFTIWDLALAKPLSLPFPWHIQYDAHVNADRYYYFNNSNELLLTSLSNNDLKKSIKLLEKPRFVRADPTGQIVAYLWKKAGVKSNGIDGANAVSTVDTKTGTSSLRFLSNEEIIDFGIVRNSQLLYIQTYEGATIVDLDSGRQYSVPHRIFEKDSILGNRGLIYSNFFAPILVLEKSRLLSIDNRSKEILVWNVQSKPKVIGRITMNEELGIYQGSNKPYLKIYLREKKGAHYLFVDTETEGILEINLDKGNHRYLSDRIGRIHSVHSNGNYLIGEKDERLVLWDLIHNEEIILDHPIPRIHFAQISDNGLFLVATNNDYIRVFSTQTGIKVLELDPEEELIGTSLISEEKIGALFTNGTVRVYDMPIYRNL